MGVTRRAGSSSYSNRLGVSTDCCTEAQIGANLLVTERLTCGRRDTQLMFGWPPNCPGRSKEKKANPSSESWLRVHKFSGGHTAATDAGKNLLVWMKRRPTGKFKLIARPVPGPDAINLGRSGRWGQLADPELKLQFAFERILVGVSLATSRFQIEHHVLHVHSQLA